MVGFTAQKRKCLLWCLIITLAAAIVSCIALAAYLPLANPDNSGSGRTGAGNARILDESKKPQPGHYAVIYARPLRKPLFDPKPVVLKKASPPKPKLNAKLLGTVLEPGFTYALFADQGQKQHLVRIGQSIAGAEVLEIFSDSVKVRFHNDEMIVRVTRKDGS